MSNQIIQLKSLELLKKKTAKQHHSKLFKTPSVNCLFFAELIELILIKGSKKKVVVNKI